VVMRSPCCGRRPRPWTVVPNKALSLSLSPSASLKRQDEPRWLPCLPMAGRPGAPLRDRLPKNPLAVPRLPSRATGSARPQVWIGVCLLLQYLLQSCSRGGSLRGIVEDTWIGGHVLRVCGRVCFRVCVYYCRTYYKAVCVGGGG
jgi:hypothetical protein